MHCFSGPVRCLKHLLPSISSSNSNTPSVTPCMPTFTSNGSLESKGAILVSVKQDDDKQEGWWYLAGCTPPSQIEESLRSDITKAFQESAPLALAMQPGDELTSFNDNISQQAEKEMRLAELAAAGLAVSHDRSTGNTFGDLYNIKAVPWSDFRSNAKVYKPENVSKQYAYSMVPHVIALGSWEQAAESSETEVTDSLNNERGEALGLRRRNLNDQMKRLNTVYQAILAAQDKRLTS